MIMLVLGGHDRLEAPLKNFARKKGIKININKPTQNLEDAIFHADIIFVITSLVSHEMVRLVKNMGVISVSFVNMEGFAKSKNK